MYKCKCQEHTRLPKCVFKYFLDCPVSFRLSRLYLSLGDISAKLGKDHQNYTVSGGFEQLDDQTILINELPVGKWTTDYKQVSNCTLRRYYHEKGLLSVCFSERLSTLEAEHNNNMYLNAALY